jgi:hypothetical protein
MGSNPTMVLILYRLGESMTVTQSLVGLNLKTLYLYFFCLIHMDQSDMAKTLLSWLRIFPDVWIYDF